GATEELDRLTAAIGTGIPSALCFDTPSDISPVATMTLGDRSTSACSLVIAGMPFAPRSVYSARSTNTPCGASPEPAGGVNDPRTGSDAEPVVVSARLMMYASIAAVCSSVSAG